MKFSHFILLLLLLPFMASSQTFVVVNGDSTYQKATYSEDSVFVQWEFKNELPKGKYWAIVETECGPDTLAYAEFISDGVKHGKWFENETNICAGLLDDETGEVTEWSSLSISDKWSETTYDSGFIISSIRVFYDSGKPRNQLFYPEQATDSNEWNIERIIYESGQVASSRVVLPNGEWQEKSYYESGRILSQGRLYIPNSSKWPITYYYESGRIKAKGYYSRYVKKGKETWISAQNGKWLYWDNKGKFIAKAWIDNGEIVKSRVKKHSGKTIEEINSVVFN